MGYDIGECLICYCRFGCNIDEGDMMTMHNICSSCFRVACPWGLIGRTCSKYYVVIDANIICDFCHEESIGLQHISLCQGCEESVPKTDKPPIKHDRSIYGCDCKKNDNIDECMGSDCEGNCSDSSCSSFHNENLQLFYRDDEDSK